MNNTLKQLKEKGGEDICHILFRCDYVNLDNEEEREKLRAYVKPLLKYINQQTTLAFEAGKAEERSNIINEITTEVENYGYTIGITNIIKKYNLEDTLKTKLTAKE